MRFCIKKVLLFPALFILLVLVGGKANAQLTIGTVDAGPYTPGSTIAATFSIDPATCIPQTNIFTLYLSDASGSFATQTAIGTYTGFYSSYVNGVLPAGLAPGGNYRLRVGLSDGTTYSTASIAFSVVAGPVVTARITSSQLNPANDETFGTCTSRPNNTIFLTNASSVGSTVTATVTNELDVAAPANITFSTPNQPFTADQAHYTVFTRAVGPGGTVATRAYLIVNNDVFTAFATSGNNVVCIPRALEYIVDINLLRRNFPGNRYVINWGDQVTTSYTLCEIQRNGGRVSHIYTESSCGLIAGSVNNAYTVVISGRNDFCGSVGTPVSTSARVVVQPVNRFVPPANNQACTNVAVTFLNNSILGEDPNNNVAECTPNQILYNWYVDGVPIEVNRPLSYNFVHTFTTNGIHRVMLTSTSQGACSADPFFIDICVQNRPQPAFTMPVTNACGPVVLAPVNTSVIDATCNPAVSYAWTVSPSTGFSYVGGTDANSFQPQFNFTSPGEYTIRLGITTQNCGFIQSDPVRVIINNGRTVDLSPNATLCNLAVYNFSATTTGPTRTTYSGTELPVLDDVYTWTITGGNFAFRSGTTAASKYPAIEFLDYATYNITVTVDNACGQESDTQTITFMPGPTVSAGADQAICYNDNVTLAGTITGGAVLTQEWVNPNGLTTGFSPNRNDLNAVYTPTAAERTAGFVELRLRVTTNLGGTCSVIEDFVRITIRPDNRVTSASTLTYCGSGTMNYTPTAALSGSTFTWTATNADGRATGFTASGSGNITDALANGSDSESAVVRYTITAVANGCTGPPMVLTVTINPRPVMTATPRSPVICSGSGSAIDLLSSIAGGRYRWTSVASPGITGNTNQATAVANVTINNTLSNSTTSSGTVTYTITPVSPANCDGLPVQAVVTVAPRTTTALAGADENICNSQTYTLSGNLPAVGTGIWSMVSGNPGATFDDPSVHNTTVRGLSPGTYRFQWQITGTTCPSTSDIVEIVVASPSVGGIVSGSNNVCGGTNSGTLTLTGHTGTVQGWEFSVNDGLNWTPLANSTTTFNYSNLNTTTWYRAVVRNASCPPEMSGHAIITVNGNGTAANAGPDQILCGGTSVTMAGNAPATGETGFWARVSGPAAVIITDPSMPATTITNIVPGNVYTFRWTIISGSACGPTDDLVTIRSLEPLTNTINSGVISACSGRSVTITGSAPTGGTGSYTYTWETSADGTTWSALAGQTTANLNTVVNATTYYRRNVTSGVCSLSSNAIQITTVPPLANNSITGTQTICDGQTPAPFTGTVPTGGGGGYIYSWEQSTDNATWTAAGSVSQEHTPSALTTTTYFRRIVTTSSCDGPLESVSNTIVVTVNRNAIASYSWVTDAACAPFTITPANITALVNTALNDTYTWYAGTTVIGTGSVFPGYVLPTPGESVNIRLVVTSREGCAQAEYGHLFSTTPGFTIGFTQDAATGCGPLSVNFTNTSAGIPATYRWDFGNGVTSTAENPPPVTFLPDPLGDDATYTITLTATTSCGEQTTTSTVIIRSAPVIAFSPDRTTGCSPLNVNFSNTSRGDNVTYTYDFGDGSPVVTTTSQANVSHIYNVTTVTDFTVTMTATNDCGTDVESHIIRVAPNNITPELVVQGNQATGCAPFTVFFRNNTGGASAFVWDFGDGSVIQTSSAPETVQHTYTRGGTYTVTLYANNDCSQASTTETIVVRGQPGVAFTAERLTGCPGLAVQFRNTSTDAISYVWDFGDGETSTEREPLHTYTEAGRNYTVTLTATNSLGCTNSVIRTDYISIVALPVAAFTVAPGNEIAVPNYRFDFSDATTGNVVSWAWDFGDGSTANTRNPSHAYAQPGTFVVTLTVRNAEGCAVTTLQVVRVIEVPGTLHLPNAFMPGSQNHEVRLFKAKGMGIESYRLTIFNKWGQVLWETTVVENGEPRDGWDGMHNGQPQPQGTYFWRAEVKFINGSEWKGVSLNGAAAKKTGEIYLIR